MQTGKAQISLYIHTICLGPSLHRKSINTEDYIDKNQKNRSASTVVHTDWSRVVKSNDVVSYHIVKTLIIKYGIIIC